MKLCPIVSEIDLDAPLRPALRRSPETSAPVSQIDILKDWCERMDRAAERLHVDQKCEHPREGGPFADDDDIRLIFA